jgi:hypothetical protein
VLAARVVVELPRSQHGTGASERGELRLVEATRSLNQRNEALNERVLLRFACAKDAIRIRQDGEAADEHPLSFALLGGQRSLALLAGVGKETRRPAQRGAIQGLVLPACFVPHLGNPLDHPEFNYRDLAS